MTLTLISDIISRKIVSRAYLQHNIRGRNPIVRACVRARVCVCILGRRCVAYDWVKVFLLTMTSDLVYRIIVSGTYLLHYLR